MRFIKDNGLTMVLTAAFLLALMGMAAAGWTAHNEELASHGARGLSLLEYCLSGDFISAVFENWESEFLQMGFYVVLTAFLFQRGSSESKDPDANQEVDEDPALYADDAHAPWAVRRGGWIRATYSYSLGIALAALFVASFVLHWLGSTAAAHHEAALHGQAGQSAFEYLADPQLWFESFQNWQSEFLSTAVLVVLTIFLRFRHSPESKPVAAPHSRTGQ